MNYFKQLQKKKPEEEEKKDDVVDDDEDDKKDKKEEDKEDKKSVPEEKKGRNIPPLITTSGKKRPPMTRERWQEMAQIRRWDVKITNISLENLFKDPYDPFVEFVIGGSFKIIQKPSKKGKMENVYTGTLGYTQKTEVLKNLESKDMRLIESRVHCEYHGSYFDIQEQYLRIDVWDWEKWNLNEFLGRVEVPLLDIIQGEVEQSFLILKAGEKKKIKLCRLNFTIGFQEIWDFMLTFSDWSGSGLKDEKGGMKVDASLELSLQSQGPFRTRVRSNIVENECNPQWPVMKGSIHYRGTINDLQNQKLSINLINGNMLSQRKVGEKVTDLLGIIDSGIISTDLIQKHKKRAPQSCSLKGRLNIQKTPRYRQSGEIIVLNSQSQYLCVSVMRVDNIVLAHDKGAVNTFIELDWGGYLKKTRTAYMTYKPIFNDTFYFPISIPEGFLGNSEPERTKAITEELKLYSCINFNFWSIDEQLSNDSLGSTVFFLSELQSAKIQEKEFFDEKTEDNQVIKIRVWSGKRPLLSPLISSGEISNIFFDVWLLYENEKKIDYEDLPKERVDKLPDGYEGLVDDWIEKERLMADAFPEETQRNFSYESRDEHNKKHFLPLYLTKLGYPNPLKALESVVQLLPIHYLTIETLKEHAYFVSLIPFTNLQGDIWNSPEFLMHMKKGEADDHAIILSSLLMSVKKEFKDPNETRSDEDITVQKVSESSKQKDLKTSSNFSPKTQASTKRGKSKKFEVEEGDMEKRVFVCLGSLKQRRTRQVWVMTIDEDYGGVRFWEGCNNSSYHLERRVDQPDYLRRYLDKEDVNYRVLFPEAPKVEEKKKESVDSDIEPMDESSEDSEESFEEEEVKDKTRKLGELRIGKGDLGASEMRFNHKQIGKKGEGVKDEAVKVEAKSFLQKKNDEEKNDIKNFLSIIQEPKAFKGAPSVELPYRTIDVIFNNKNVFMNKQHFDPARIYFDLYDTDLWHPFIPKSKIIFPPFYSPPTLLPPLGLPSAKKLLDILTKEMKIRISALRSGKNLGTSWKNQKDPCVDLMEKHLTYLEEVARGEHEEDQIKIEKRDWSLKMRQYMPTNYRFAAIPSHFNYPEPDRIASVFIENAQDFFIANFKDMKWALAINIFPYVGKIISIRIIVAYFYKFVNAD